MSVQAKVSDELHAVTVGLGQRLGAVEQRGLGSESPPTPSPTDRNIPDQIESDDRGVEPGHGSMSPLGVGALDMEECSGCAEGAAEESGVTAPASLTWNTVAKRGGRRLQAAGAPGVPAQPKSRPNSRRDKRIGVVGTGAGGNIRTVKTKLVSVFATKFTPDLDVDTLTKYLKDKLRQEVTCLKINSGHGRFSSFKITAECKDVKDLYDPDLWPEGAFVRRFYEVRKPKITVMSASAEVAVKQPGVTDLKLK